MSSPQEFLRDGRLADALDAQIQAVKSKPTDSDERFLLFVLHCFSGNLEKAVIHLDTLVKVESETRGGASIYHALLSAEYERTEVFSGKGEPTISPGEFPGIADRIAGAKAIGRSDTASALAAIDRANEASEELGGQLNGQEFSSICDYDDLLSDVLEVYAGGRYMWIPLSDIRKLSIQEPSHQLDLLWAPAELELTSGETSNVHLPTLYPGSHASEDGLIQLGRSTEWTELGDGVFRGVGQKLFFATQGEEEIEQPILGIRELEITSPASSEE